MAEQKLDEFHSHEVLHTLHVVRGLIDRELSEHPFVSANPVVKNALERAQRALGTAYQLTGAIEFEATAAGVEGRTDAELDELRRVYNNAYAEQRRDGVGGGEAERHAMRVLLAHVSGVQGMPLPCQAALDSPSIDMPLGLSPEERRQFILKHASGVKGPDHA